MRPLRLAAVAVAALAAFASPASADPVSVTPGQPIHVEIGLLCHEDSCIVVDEDIPTFVVCTGSPLPVTCTQ
jgi:hypothetical protein